MRRSLLTAALMMIYGTTRWFLDRVPTRPCLAGLEELLARQLAPKTAVAAASWCLRRAFDVALSGRKESGRPTVGSVETRLIQSRNYSSGKISPRLPRVGFGFTDPLQSGRRAECEPVLTLRLDKPAGLDRNPGGLYPNRKFWENPDGLGASLGDNTAVIVLPIRPGARRL